MNKVYADLSNCESFPAKFVAVKVSLQNLYSHNCDVTETLWDFSPKKKGHKLATHYLRNNEKKVPVLSELPLFTPISLVPDLF